MFRYTLLCVFIVLSLLNSFFDSIKGGGLA